MLLPSHVAREIQHRLIVLRRAAARLAARGHDLAAGARQHAHRRPAHVGHHDVHHAAQEERDAMALRALSRA